MHSKLLRAKDEIRKVEREIDYLKNKIKLDEARIFSYRTTITACEDKLEELKFQILEMELER
jgi:peptidoglycan hydrolase CwlO-like protein